MNTKPLVLLILVGAFFAAAVSSGHAGRPAKPATGTPPPPVDSPVASPR